MLEKLVKTISPYHRCVVLTGAGISAESGVPTFRGKEGLWGKFKPEELATMSAFMANPEVVWEWYNWRRELMENVEPNPGHWAISEMEKWFDEFTLITQNVDGLHRLARTRHIIELHGNIYRNKCADCNQSFEIKDDIDPNNIPRCDKCEGKIRPDVVWFGEMLDSRIIDEAFYQSEHADVFFSVGTSAVVHPAASLPLVAKNHGAVVVEVNIEETPITYLADFHIPSKSGEFLPELIKELKKIDSEG
ncbi:MAG: NAD-dependent deacylase [FCB group bacterium]|nr:NAD-dependent deacylase [FCB group bacterium]